LPVNEIAGIIKVVGAETMGMMSINFDTAENVLNKAKQSL
jgi:hypothetical protein